MLLRLADRQGILRGPNLSRFQQWALAYLIVEDRKEHFDELYDFQEFLFSLINPKKYQEVMASHVDDLGEGELHITPDDFDTVDQWLRDLDKPKTTTIKG